MRFHDDFTPTVEAAADFEAGRTYQQSRLELAEEAGYDPDDDTLGRPSTLPLTDPARFARACAAVREMKAEAWRRERGAGS